jgi:hypothetical protein
VRARRRRRRMKRVEGRLSDVWREGVIARVTSGEVGCLPLDLHSLIYTTQALDIACIAVYS